MTDNTLTNTVTEVIEPGIASQADHDAEAAAAAARAINKMAVFAALARAGITHVNVCFDGCGDDGQIEDIAAFSDQQRVDLPAERLETREVRWHHIGSPTAMSVQAAIEELAYDWLDQVQSGWENDNGAFGDFMFDVADRTIALEFNARFTATDTSNHSF